MPEVVVECPELELPEGVVDCPEPGVPEVVRGCPRGEVLKGGLTEAQVQSAALAWAQWQV